MKKRGLSPIVASILLIMLTIVAVAIIANFVTQFVKTNLPKTTECVPYKNYFEFQEEFASGGSTQNYNCYRNIAGIGREYLFSVKARSTDETINGSIKGFNIVFNKENAETSVIEVYEKNADAGVSMKNPGEITIPSMGGARTYIYKVAGSEIFKSMDVYPVLKNDRLCDKSDSIDIIECAPGLI